jgi:glycine C-acetyltransferase
VKTERWISLLRASLARLDAEGRCKGRETVLTGVLAAKDGHGPRYTLAGQGEEAFLRMNANGYLGLALHPELIAAEEAGSRRFGTGPGAVRFISGTFSTHVDLEKRLARFHGRDGAMIFSAAYAAVLGVLPQLITDETIVVSDALNHNCIINAVRLSRPAAKAIYPHLSMAALDEVLAANVGKGKRVLVVTDGIFSMRGDHAPLDRIVEICRRYDPSYEEGVVTVVDDSHGVGAFGETGRGTEEYCAAACHVLVATLGKALGVNGGYVVADETVINYLRETAPFYIYSNPIAPAEAAAALRAVDILDSPEGLKRLKRLRALTARLEAGLARLGLETIPGPHPIVPLMIRDTARTAALVAHLFANGILATGLTYPVVPRGDEEIRFQVCATHTEKDIDTLLEVLAGFKG